MVDTRAIATTNYTSNRNLYSWSTVDINGSLTVNSPYTVNVYSGEEININVGANIAPGFTLQRGRAVQNRVKYQPIGGGHLLLHSRNRPRQRNQTIDGSEIEYNLYLSH
jgi:hypothetical protein